MATDIGIDISESQLLEENGRAHFMTKHFDRDENAKHHIHAVAYSIMISITCMATVTNRC